MVLINDILHFRILQTLVCLFLLIRHSVNGAGSLTDVTSHVGLSNVNGVIAAYCDFDSDRDTDILVIGTKGMF